MKPRSIVLFLSLIVFLITTSFSNNRIKTGFITEGVSVDDIAIGMKLGEAKALLNDRYRRIKWKEHSYEYRYKKTGISIYVMQKDTSKTIFAIDLDLKTWHGATQKGLGVNKELKVKDVIAIYGKPRWLALENTKTASLHYDSMGVYFSIRFLNSKLFNAKANNDSIFADERIENLTLGKPGTSY